MLKKISLFALLLFTFITQAQVADPNRKTIHVSGSAEMEVIPDEIYFSIVLEEYVDNKVKTTIATLEEQLKAGVAAAGLEGKNLDVEKIYGQAWVRRKRKQDEFIEKKVYRLKVSEPSKIDAVLEKIDARGIDNVYISSYSHSKIIEYRKQLKIEAIKNAKEKAKYLTEAIGEQLGGALFINEAGNDLPITYNITPTSSYGGEGYVYGEYSNSFSKMDTDKVNKIGFKSIKLRFEVQVDFSLK